MVRREVMRVMMRMRVARERICVSTTTSSRSTRKIEIGVIRRRRRGIREIERARRERTTPPKIRSVQCSSSVNHGRRITAQHAFSVRCVRATLGTKNTFRGQGFPVDLVSTTHPGENPFTGNRMIEASLTNVLGERSLFR